MEYRPCGSGCTETCETINYVEPRMCSEDLTEGCYCPEDQVMHNGTCVPKRNCLICDDEGHIDGDTWYPDKCMTCSCANKIVRCQKTQCPGAIHCDEYYKLVTVPALEDECCPNYICGMKLFLIK